MSVITSGQRLRRGKASSRKQQSSQKCATIGIGHDFPPLFPTGDESFWSWIAGLAQRAIGRRAILAQLIILSVLWQVLVGGHPLDRRYDPSLVAVICTSPAGANLGRNNVCGCEVS